MTAVVRLKAGFQVTDDWEGRFACTLPGATLEWWDLDYGTADQLSEGRRRCFSCPVQDRCRAEAKRKRERGLFGGWVLDRGREITLDAFLAKRSKARNEPARATAEAQRASRSAKRRAEVAARTSELSPASV